MYNDIYKAVEELKFLIEDLKWFKGIKHNIISENKSEIIIYCSDIITEYNYNIPKTWHGFDIKINIICNEKKYLKLNEL